MVTRKRILFVDDEPNLLGGLQNVLRRNRHEWDMVFALGGEAALAELAKEPFDVVVSDMRMPGIDGAELLRRVKDQYPSVARIVLSGHAERESVVRALPVAHQFLSKPCDAEVLRTVIERTCNLQAILHDPGIRDVVGRLDRLPSVPRTYLELREAVTNPEGGLAAIAGIVEKDPAMAGKVLQLVNSAYFGLRQHVTSVHRAVVYLGAELIQGLALTAEIFDTLTIPKVHGFCLDQLQEHSLLTAKLAKRFVSDPRVAEEIFAAAIVHDIGKVILALGAPKRFGEVLQQIKESGRRPYDVEKEMLGVTHAEIGAYLLGVWGLPFSIVEAVCYHHTPHLLADGVREVLSAVHIADALVNEAAGRGGQSPEHALLNQDYVDASGLASELPKWRRAAAADLETLAGAC